VFLSSIAAIFDLRKGALATIAFVVVRIASDRCSSVCDSLSDELKSSVDCTLGLGNPGSTLALPAATEKLLEVGYESCKMQHTQTLDVNIKYIHT